MNLERSKGMFLQHLKRKGYSEETQNTYERQIRLFMGFLTEYYPRIAAPADVRRDIIVDYQDYLGEVQLDTGRPLTNKSIQLKLVSLKSFFNFLHTEDHVTSNPTKSIALPKQERRLPKNILTEQEVMEILESCDMRKPVGVRNRAICETAYACGIRTAELCALKVQDIDLGEQTALIQKGKGNVSRWFHSGSMLPITFRSISNARADTFCGKRRATQDIYSSPNSEIHSTERASTSR